MSAFLKYRNLLRDRFLTNLKSLKKGEVVAELKDFVVQTGTIIAGLHFLGAYVFHISACQGPSMLPTFRVSGDLVLVDKYSGHFTSRNYANNDIIIAWAPYDPEKLVCKRIAGCAGDIIDTEYQIGTRVFRGKMQVPDGHVWLLGDNPENSKDSRHYGAVPVQLIEGRVVLKLWWPPQLSL